MKNNTLTKLAGFLRRQGAESADVAADIVDALGKGVDPRTLAIFTGDFPAWEISPTKDGLGWTAGPVSYGAYCEVRVGNANTATVEFATVSGHGFRCELNGGGARFDPDGHPSERYWADNLRGWVAMAYRKGRLEAEWADRKYRAPSRWEIAEAVKIAEAEKAEAEKAADAERKAKKEEYDALRRATPGTRAWRRAHRHCA